MVRLKEENVKKYVVREGKIETIKPDTTFDMFSFRTRKNDDHARNHGERTVTRSSLRALITNICCTRMSRWHVRMAATSRDMGVLKSFYTATYRQQSNPVISKECETVV